jgi:hypothetical protein
MNKTIPIPVPLRALTLPLILTPLPPLCTPQDNVDAVFPLIVPALCSQLVSSRSGAVSASPLLDSLASQTSKPHLLTAAYVATLQLHRSNVRLQAAIVDKLSGTSQLHSRLGNWCLR